MNNTVYIDPSFSDDERRQRVYDGQLFVYSPRKSTLASACAASRIMPKGRPARSAILTLGVVVGTEFFDLVASARVFEQPRACLLHVRKCERI